MNRFIFLTLMLFFVFISYALAESSAVFKGRPIIRISEGGINRVTEQLEPITATNFACVINQIKNEFYWVSRGNTLMYRIESGAFITFIAANGSGYVRVVNPKMKTSVSLMGQTEKDFDYIEHMLIGLGSVTYYGKAD